MIETRRDISFIDNNNNQRIRNKNIFQLNYKSLLKADDFNKSETTRGRRKTTKLLLRLLLQYLLAVKKQYLIFDEQ